MTQNLALARQASTKIKANAVLEDFGHEHMAAVDRDREQLKLRYAMHILVQFCRFSCTFPLRHHVASCCLISLGCGTFSQGCREKQSKAVSKRRHSSVADVRRPVSQRISVPFLEADDDDDDDYGQPRTSLGTQQAEVRS